MPALITSNVDDHISKKEMETTSNIAILYNAKLFQDHHFLNYTENQKFECLFLDHDILSFIEFKDILDVDILYLCLGQWKVTHQGVLKMVKAIHKDIKIVLINDNAGDVPCSTIFDFEIQGLLSSSSFFKSSYDLNQLILDEVFIFDQSMKAKLHKIVVVKEEEENDVFQEKNNHYKLNSKERKVLQLLAEGQSYEEIAEGIAKSVDSVRYYIKSLYKKLNVNNKGAAIRIYLKNEKNDHIAR